MAIYNQFDGNPLIQANMQFRKQQPIVQKEQLPSKEQIIQMGKEGKLKHMGGILVNYLKGVIPEAKDMAKKIITNQNVIEIKPEKVTQISVTPKTMPLKQSNSENTIGGYNFSGYATALDALTLMKKIYNSTPIFKSAQDIQNEINRVMSVKNKAKPPKSPISGDMIMGSATKYGIDPRVLVTLLRKESGLGINMLTQNNPGNISNTDEGGRQHYATIEEGVDAAAREIVRRKV